MIKKYLSIHFSVISIEFIFNTKKITSKLVIKSNISSILLIF